MSGVETRLDGTHADRAIPVRFQRRGWPQARSSRPMAARSRSQRKPQPDSALAKALARA